MVAWVQWLLVVTCGCYGCVVACTDTDTRYKILDTGYKIIGTDEVTYTFKQRRALYRFRYRLMYRFMGDGKRGTF